MAMNMPKGSYNCQRKHSAQVELVQILELLHKLTSTLRNFITSNIFATEPEFLPFHLLKAMTSHSVVATFINIQNLR